MTARPHTEIEGLSLGRFGRLGLWMADHRRIVALVWAAIAISLGAFAPFAERALSGAGWEASGSESVEAREMLQERFPGRGAYALTVVVSSSQATVDDAAFQTVVARVASVLAADEAVARVVRPEPARSISPDRRSVLVHGLAAQSPAAMVEAAGRLKEQVAQASVPGIEARLGGPPTLWSDFNAENKSAMLKAELLSWPLTLGLLVVAFGSLVAAGLPLLLTMAGLMAASGLLFLVGQLADVSLWAMNFAMMFAIALGIDYALFVVVRFRAALAAGFEPREAAAATMETTGKAVFVSGLAVITALLGVMLVPSPNFRSVPLGIVLAVGFVLAASLTLLPAVLSTLGGRVNRLAVRRSALAYRSARFARLGERVWRRPGLFGAIAVAALLLLAAPALGLRTGMPSILAVPDDSSSRQAYELVQESFGPGAPAQLQVVVPERQLPAVEATLAADPGIASMPHAERSGGYALLEVIPTAEPASEELAATIDRLRQSLPQSALVGGSAAESHDLAHTLVDRMPLVYAVVLSIGFILLVALLRAPLISAAAVLLNLFATAGAFGIARLVFQEGLLDGVLRFESQGFLDAWAPVFFFGLIFALAMDYTVFLLATVRERFEQTGDARRAAVEGLAQTGRIINAAAGVMVVVFLTFALAGPIPLKEMGLILAVAVLLDALLIRLVLLPVLLRLLGAHAWWVPAWLNHVLPPLHLSHSEAARDPRRVPATAEARNSSVSG
jgi:putative drug exporter of the RND superfamily